MIAGLLEFSDEARGASKAQEIYRKKGIGGYLSLTI